MTNFTVNIVQPILSIIVLISFWKIFEDRGEKGWKSIIPILSTLTFGKLANDTKHAKGRIISTILLIASFFGLFFAYVIGLSGNNVNFTITDMNDINGIVIDNQYSSDLTYTGNPMVLFLFLGLFIVSLVAFLINHIKLSKSFDIANNGPSWMIVLWIFFSAGAAVYYAFIHQNYDIPGVTNKVVDNPETDNNINE